MKTAAALVLASALILGLAGCTLSASASASVPASQIAHTGAIALKNEVGTSYLPKVNCGSGRVDLKVGKKIHCTVIDPKTPSQVYDSVVTITKVSGLKYSIDIKVAITPKS